jgi:hypothetical protein
MSDTKTTSTRPSDWLHYFEERSGSSPCRAHGYLAEDGVGICLSCARYAYFGALHEGTEDDM